MNQLPRIRYKHAPLNFLNEVKITKAAADTDSESESESVCLSVFDAFTSTHFLSA